MRHNHSGTQGKVCLALIGSPSDIYVPAESTLAFQEELRIVLAAIVSRCQKTFTFYYVGFMLVAESIADTA